MQTIELAQPDSINAEYAADQISAGYLEVERLVWRVERAASHYDVFGLGHSAGIDEIRLAQNQALALLHNSSVRMSVHLPDLMLARIDMALGRISHAFSVLSDFVKRREYDSLLSADGRPDVDLDGSAVGPPEPEREQRPAIIKPERKGLPFLAAPRMLKAHLSDCSASERRKWERYKLSLPVYLTGHDRVAGEWHEITRTLDVSRLGAMLLLRRRVRHRALLHLALPLPMKLRCHRHSEPSYSVYALVRRIEPPRDGLRVVAVEFVGEHAPRNYHEKPWATYGTRWTGLERRRAPRDETSEVVYIEYLDERLGRIRQDVAVTENLSHGGMRVFVKSAPPEFEMVRVTCPDRGFESLADVRNRYVGRDHFERLCLKFSSPIPASTL